jgi:two-component system CheB/CheR fusion protein
MRSLKVLIVEDHSDTAEMLSRWSQFAGHRTEVSRTGFQALETGAVFQPDVILLDLGLPDIDGWELAREFRGHALLSRAMIIAVSAYQTLEDRRRSEMAGIDHHLAKPVHQAEVLGLLAQAAG